MRIQPSPLHLHDYFLTELNFRINPLFKSDQSPLFSLKDLQVKREIQDLSESEKKRMILRVSHQPKSEINSPYSFTVEVMGTLEISKKFPEEKKQMLLQVNGASILYGVIREILRSITSNAPYSQVLLPSLSFAVDSQEEESAKESSTAPHATKS